MRSLKALLFTGAALAVPVSASEAEPGQARECVVLLHGLCRTHKSMESLADFLRGYGYDVVNISYPSRSARIEDLAEEALGGALALARKKNPTRIHFVAHSLGGILVRQYMKQHRVNELGRVVMLGPPNAGSEVVDRLKGWRVFRMLNGEAGSQLGTSPGSLPNQLGPVDFELGVIAGNRSINWINSSMIPGLDDGKVAVERTKIEGMRDHISVPVSHPFLMKRRSVLRQVLCFLQRGHFEDTKCECFEFEN